MIELEKQATDEISAFKNEFEIKIENLKREVNSRKQEFESLK
jgi:phage host-nuclease inhibitor protein Gam